MSCQNHPDRESTASCQFCGKELCEDCEINIANKSYCKECMSELVGPELADIATKNATNPQATEEESQNRTDNPQNRETEPPKENIQDPLAEPKIAQKPTQNNENDPNANLDNVISSSDAKNSAQEAIDNNYDDIYSDDRLYDDIRVENSSEAPNNPVEEKYEKYLDDLYFDETQPPQENTAQRVEKELSLSEQLANEEAEHGSLTKEPYIPQKDETEDTSQDSNQVPIMKNLRKNDEKYYNSEGKDKEYTSSSLHNKIHYKKEEEKESFSSLELVLTGILLIMIIFVIIYVIYLFALSDQYPTFFDAIGGLFTNPGKLINDIFS